MCNRIHFSGREIPQVVERLRVMPIAQPAFEIWPTARAPVVVQPHDSPAAIEMLPWGIHPEWAQKRSDLLLFARCETARTKPTFREAFHQHRCLILASAFQETVWFEVPAAPMIFAGLYVRDYSMNTMQKHFAILSTEATAAVAPYNPRMPLILPPEHWEAWLDPITPPDALMPLLKPWAGPLEPLPYGPNGTPPEHSPEEIQRLLDEEQAEQLLLF